MYLSFFVALAYLVHVSNAHFRLLYPAPRGDFVADQEPKFCGGYDNAGTRGMFPLYGGFFSIRTGHPNWTAGVIISTVQNPISFDNFSSNGQQQIVGPFANEEDAGIFCMPLDLSNDNVAGVQDGANVTIQVVFEGGDGPLYQCADLTLSSNFTISNVSCQNETVTPNSTTPQPAGSLRPVHNLGVVGFTVTALVLGLGGVTMLMV